MLHTKAAFRCKEPEIEAKDCVVGKVIRLSGAEFDNFSRNLLREWDFIRDNQFDTPHDAEGRTRCMLIVGEGRRDGILVDSQGYDYARYSTFMPNVEDFLTVGQYPALAALNRKLTGIVDIIAEKTGKHVFDLCDFDTDTGVDLMANGALRGDVLNMLRFRPEIKDFSLDKNELTVYYNKTDLELAAENLADPTVTPADMYAYGYGWEGMIPLGKDRALELFDKGCEVFRLYEDSTEGAAESRDEIETYDGLFGVEDPAWEKPEQEPPLQVFILNREKYDRGEAAGEWLPLPADADTLRGLFDRIGIDRPGEGAFTITAVRVREECVGCYISKYDSLDELNMLASYMESAVNWYDFEKFQAVITSGVTDVGSGTAALINLLDTNNIECFELIDAQDAESLARYYDSENHEIPEDASFEEYGNQCVKEEGGRFTEWGYIKQKHNDFSTQYAGVVPEEYKITGMALHALRLSKQERGETDEKPSVLGEIRASRKTPRQPGKPAPDKSRRKGETEL